MAIITSAVFLIELLCVIVPCDPRYKLPDLSPDPHKIGHPSGGGYKDLDRDGKSNFWNKFSNPIHNKEEALLGNEALDFDVSKIKYSSPFVRTNSGDIEGYYMKVVGGREINAFEGIPYAEAPMGKLRFKSPVPKTPWEGILKTMREGDPCLQYNTPRAFRVLGTENCLFINSYSAKLPTKHDPKPKLPVVVFVHGGGFYFGSTRAYGPSYLMQKDIVLFSFQYRVGVLGFMSTGDEAMPGNWGLKDQVLALKWIHENAEFFGGDPTRITIMGQSAGSVSVHYHMISKQSRPYFQKAISLSGTTFNYWSIHTPFEARNITNTLANLVGCPTEDSFKLADCMRNTNPINLVKFTPRFLDDWPYPANAFRPTIESLGSSPDPFITDSPVALYQKNEVAKIPWICTTVSGEGYSFLIFPFITFQFQHILRKNWARLAPDLIDIDNIDGLDYPSITEKLTKFYFKKLPPEKAPIHPYAKIVTDRLFVTGLYKAIQAHSQIAPTYSYIFDYNGQYNAIENYGYPNYEWGVGHAEDVFYITNSSTVYQGFKRGDPEFKISQFLINLIYNFAAKGEPLYTTKTGEDIQVWKPHQGPHNLKFLLIDNKSTRMVKDPFKKRIRFWDSLKLPDTPTEEEALFRYSYSKNSNSHDSLIPQNTFTTENYINKYNVTK